ncbi:MAG TPA: hypothetical protein VKA67_02745, partial [Verrucomicrobiae bacterium]|nr:hypothetical protein [Verrucomicrobiae bacterium]
KRLGLEVFFEPNAGALGEHALPDAIAGVSRTPQKLQCMLVLQVLSRNRQSYDSGILELS